MVRKPLLANDRIACSRAVPPVCRDLVASRDGNVIGAGEPGLPWVDAGHKNDRLGSRFSSRPARLVHRNLNSRGSIGIRDASGWERI